MGHPDELYMKAAIEEAKRAVKQEEYAIGAVVVFQGKIVSIAHTTTHSKKNDPSAHGEMSAIRKAAKKIGSRYLHGAWLYATAEPCPMCTAVAIWAKMEGIVYGATKEDALAIYKKQKDSRYTWRQINISAEEVIKKGEPKLKLHKGFMRKECLKLFKLNS